MWPNGGLYVEGSLTGVAPGLGPCLGLATLCWHVKALAPVRMQPCWYASVLVRRGAQPAGHNTFLASRGGAGHRFIMTADELFVLTTRGWHPTGVCVMHGRGLGYCVRCGVCRQRHHRREGAQSGPQRAGAKPLRRGPLRHDQPGRREVGGGSMGRGAGARRGGEQREAGGACARGG